MVIRQYARGLICGLAAVIAVVAAESAQAAPIVTLQAAAGTDLSNLTTGQAFDLQLVLSGVTNEDFFYLISHISASQSLVQLLGETQGPVIPAGVDGATFLASWESTASIFAGAYGGYNGEPGRGIKTNGLLGTIHLQALAAGTGVFAITQLEQVLVAGESSATVSAPINYTIRNVASVPEPVTLSLLGVAVGAGLYRRRRAAR